MPINHAIANDVDAVLLEKPSTSQATGSNILRTYEDDFLDVNCGDMDFF